MPKKIYDIKPPKLAQKKSAHVAVKTATPGGHKKTHARRSAPKRSRKKMMWMGAGILVVAALVYLFFALPRATITISPKEDILSFQQNLTADKSASDIDETNATIPAQYIEVIKTASQDFPATGNASNVGQASGTITVYNKNDPPASLTFKAGTHFMSDSGKLFVATQKVVLPAASKKGGKLTPGSVQVPIQAVDGGDSYNIPPSNFSVPGLKGTDYYYSVYGVSTQAMSGGYSGKVKKVTDDDIQGAQDVLVKKVSDDAVNEVKKEIPQDSVLLDNALLTNTVNSSTAAKSGTVADTFTYNASVKASALVFKKADVEKFAKDYLLSQLPTGKSLLDNSYQASYSAKSVDVSGGKTSITVNFSSKIYPSVDSNSMSLALMGKNTSQINDTIRQMLGDQVQDVKIKLWPFWVSRAPDSQGRVKVVLRFQ